MHWCSTLALISFWGKNRSAPTSLVNSCRRTWERNKCYDKTLLLGNHQKIVSPPFPRSTTVRNDIIGATNDWSRKRIVVNCVSLGEKQQQQRWGQYGNQLSRTILTGISGTQGAHKCFETHTHTHKFPFQVAVNSFFFFFFFSFFLSFCKKGRHAGFFFFLYSFSSSSFRLLISFIAKTPLIESQRERVASFCCAFLIVDCCSAGAVRLREFSSPAAQPARRRRRFSSSSSIAFFVLSDSTPISSIEFRIYGLDISIDKGSPAMSRSHPPVWKPKEIYFVGIFSDTDNNRHPFFPSLSLSLSVVFPLHLFERQTTSDTIKARNKKKTLPTPVIRGWLRVAIAEHLNNTKSWC